MPSVADILLKLKAEDKASGVFSKFGESIQGAVTPIGAVAAGVAGAVAGAVTLANSFGEAGAELLNMSKRTGVSVETLSALKFAANQNDLSMDQLQTSFIDMNQHIAEFGEGSTSAAERFERVGLGLQDLQGLSPEQQFFTLIDAIAGIENQAERTAAAMGVFGEEAGENILPLLEGGSEGIQAMMDQAEELGGVMTTESAEAAVEYNKKMEELKTTIGSAANQVGEALAPAIGELAGVVAGLLAPALQFLRPILGLVAKVLGIVGNIAVAVLVPVFEILSPLIADIATLFGNILDNSMKLADEFLTALVPALEETWRWFTGLVDGLTDFFQQAKKTLGLTVETNDEDVQRLTGFIEDLDLSSQSRAWVVNFSTMFEKGEKTEEDIPAFLEFVAENAPEDLENIKEGLRRKGILPLGLPTEMEPDPEQEPLEPPPVEPPAPVPLTTNTDTSEMTTALADARTQFENTETEFTANATGVEFTGQMNLGEVFEGQEITLPATTILQLPDTADLEKVNIELTKLAGQKEGLQDLTPVTMALKDTLVFGEDQASVFDIPEADDIQAVNDELAKLVEQKEGLDNLVPTTTALKATLVFEEDEVSIYELPEIADMEAVNEQMQTLVDQKEPIEDLTAAMADFVGEFDTGAEDIATKATEVAIGIEDDFFTSLSASVSYAGQAASSLTDIISEMYTHMATQTRRYFNYVNQSFTRSPEEAPAPEPTFTSRSFDDRAAGAIVRRGNAYNERRGIVAATA